MRRRIMSGSNVMETSHFLLVFLLGYCLAVIEGELRCYCNESGCVTTGYMCKSSAGQCFTAVEVRGEVTHHTHGCLDNLPRERQKSCRVGVNNIVSASKSDSTNGHVPLLFCCNEHMCNYREDIDVSIFLTPKYNGTFRRGSAPTDEDYAVYSRNHHNSRDDDRDLWFKAAVIAVPIAGGFILVLLVLLAVHMLKTDSRHHRRLIHIRRQRSLTKAHMYISEHFSGKGNKQHFSLFNEKTQTRSSKMCTDQAAATTIGHTCTDGSSQYCSHSQHSEKTANLDSSTRCGNTGSLDSSTRCGNAADPSSSSIRCGSWSSQRNSSFSNTTVTCSNDENHHKDASGCVVKQCSPQHLDLVKDLYVTRDINIKTGKDCHTVHHGTRLDPSGAYHGPNHQLSSVTTWESSCLKGPTAVV